MKQKLYKTIQKHFKPYDWTQLTQDIPPERRQQIFARCALLFVIFLIFIIGGIFYA